MALVASGCDAGHQDNAQTQVAPINIVATNVSPSQPLVAGAPIEISFDRLLLPTSVTRQSFAVQDVMGNFLEPDPSYDPVARVVRLCVTLSVDQSYKLTILSPQSATDMTGLRAIDGAQLDPSQTASYTFPVVTGPPYAGADACPQGGGAGEDGGAAVAPSPIDFCSQVLPIFSSKCGTSVCHAGSLPAEGLQLTTGQGILATAIGRASQESNTGSRASVSQPQAGGLFGVDMAIVAAADPGDSWVLYKMLMAVPPPCSSVPGSAEACGEDAGADAGVANPHDVPWTPLSDGERSTLAGIIPGREMPFPVDPSASLGDSTNTAANLTVDELETVSLWIQQGATVTSCGQ